MARAGGSAGVAVEAGFATRGKRPKLFAVPGVGGLRCD